MASPILEINPLGGDPFGQSGSALPEPVSRAHSMDHGKGITKPESDTVTLSMGVKARRLKEQGASVDEIANRLNADVKTVESYLGIVPAPPATVAQQLKQEGESVSQIAVRLGVDTKTVNRFLAIPPAPAVNLAKQLEQQGESVIEIANRLGVDVKTVNRYLGIAPATVVAIDKS
jgi:DNA-binding CsgD family transcriptional regulator